jgi:hypothetical protein
MIPAMQEAEIGESQINRRIVDQARSYINLRHYSKKIL